MCAVVKQCAWEQSLCFLSTFTFRIKKKWKKANEKKNLDVEKVQMIWIKLLKKTCHKINGSNEILQQMEHWDGIRTTTAISNLMQFNEFIELRSINFNNFHSILFFSIDFSIFQSSEHMACCINMEQLAMAEYLNWIKSIRFFSSPFATLKPLEMWHKLCHSLAPRFLGKFLWWWKYGHSKLL